MPDAETDWQVFPDHQHVRIEAGRSVPMRFRFVRRSTSELTVLTIPRLTSRVDYHGDQMSVAVGERVTPVDVAVVTTPEYFQSADSGFVRIVGEQAAVGIDSDTFDLPQGPLTLEAWVRIPQANSASRGIISRTESSEYALFLQGEIPQFEVHLNGRYVTAKALRPLPVGRWVHVAGVFDGRQLRIYLDGELLGSQAGQGRRQTNDLPLFIGADPDGRGRPTRPLQGDIDEARLSKSVRYTDNFTPARRFESDAETVLLFHLDQTTGPLVLDASSTQTIGHLVHGAEVVGHSGE